VVKIPKRRKLIVTEDEYKELRRLMSIVKDNNALPGEKRLAMAKYDKILLHAINRNG
jgi:hypothetical protein